MPDALQHCQAEPAPPLVLSRDADLADYVVALADAGDDCRAKLAAVARVLTPIAH